MAETDNSGQGQQPDLAALGIDVHVPLGQGGEASEPNQVEKTAAEPPKTDGDLRAEIARLKQEKIDQQRRYEAQLGEANQKVQHFATQADQSQRNQQSAYLISITNAIEARTQAMIALEVEYATAREQGDFKKEAELVRKMARVENELAQLEEGKRTAEAQQQQAQQQRPQPVQHASPVDAFLNQTGIRGKSADWIKQHPQVVDDPESLRAAHRLALKAGYTMESPEYFSHVEKLLGFESGAGVETTQANPQPEPEPRRAPPAASAPPTRQAVQTNGHRADGGIRLSREQVRAAEIAGVSPEEYAAGREMARKLGMLN